MKRILPFFLVVASLISAMAAGHNHGSSTIDYTAADGSWSFNDGVFTFNSNYVWTGFALREDKYSDTSVLNLNDLVEMGYYKIENGKAGTPLVMFQRDDSGEMSIKNSVILEKGDKIGVYAKIQSTTQTPVSGHYEVTVNGKTYTSESRKIWVDGYRKNNGKWVNGQYYTGSYVVDDYKTTTAVTTWTTTDNAIDGAYKNTNNVDHDSLAAGSNPQYFCLFLDSNPGPTTHFEYYLDHVISGDNYDDFISDVIDANTGDDGKPITVITDITGEPVTTGQPLPGLLLTLACGAAATGLCTRKRRNLTQA